MDFNKNEEIPKETTEPTVTAKKPENEIPKEVTGDTEKQETEEIEHSQNSDGSDEDDEGNLAYILADLYMGDTIQSPWSQSENEDEVERSGSMRAQSNNMIEHLDNLAQVILADEDQIFERLFQEMNSIMNSIEEDGMAVK